VSTATTTSTTQVDLPRVNLLPPEIFEKRQLQRTQAGLSVVVIAAVVGVALVYLDGGAAVTDGKSRLAASQAIQVDLQKKVSQLSYVTAQKAQAEQAKSMLVQAMGSAVPFSTYLSDLSLLTPKNVWFTSITFTNSVTPGTLVAGAPAPTTVGNVSFSGKALAHNDVATWLDSAAKEIGFANTYFSTSSENVIPGTGVTPGSIPKTWVVFSSTADLSSAALCSAQSGKC
jgi:Tfp pilus assembly protein PilN